MTKEDFWVDMKLIFQDFGKEEFGPNKLRLIFESVQDLQPDEFRNIIKFFLRTRSTKFPPLPEHFIEEASKIRKRGSKPHLQLVAQEPEINHEALGQFLGDVGATSALDAMLQAMYKLQNK